MFPEDQAILFIGNAGCSHPAECVDSLKDEWAELAAIEAEAIGWLPLEEGAYLHVGHPEEDEVVITVTGVTDALMVGMNVLLVGW